MAGNTLRIGIQTSSLRLPFKQALHVAAEMDYDGVGIDARSELRPAELTRTGVRDVRHRLEERGLGVSSVTFLTRSGLAEPHRSEQRLAATTQAMRMAYQIGARCVVTNVGRLPEDASSPSWHHLVEASLQLAKASEREGAALALQTSGEGEAGLVRLLEELPDGLVGVDFHPGHLISAQRTPGHELSTLGPHVIHVHACDKVRDLAAQSCVAVELGRGSIDWPELLAGLEEFDYRGWLTVDASETGDPLAYAGQAVQYLRRLD